MSRLSSATLCAVLLLSVATLSAAKEVTRHASATNRRIGPNQFLWAANNAPPAVLSMRVTATSQPLNVYALTSGEFSAYQDGVAPSASSTLASDEMSYVVRDRKEGLGDSDETYYLVIEPADETLPERVAYNIDFNSRESCLTSSGAWIGTNLVLLLVIAALVAVWYRRRRSKLSREQAVINEAAEQQSEPWDEDVSPWVLFKPNRNDLLIKPKEGLPQFLRHEIALVQIWWPYKNGVLIKSERAWLYVTMLSVTFSVSLLIVLARNGTSLSVHVADKDASSNASDEDHTTSFANIALSTFLTSLVTFVAAKLSKGAFKSAMKWALLRRREERQSTSSRLSAADMSLRGMLTQSQLWVQNNLGFVVFGGTLLVMVIIVIVAANFSTCSTLEASITVFLAAELTRGIIYESAEGSIWYFIRLKFGRHGTESDNETTNMLDADSTYEPPASEPHTSDAV